MRIKDKIIENTATSPNNTTEDPDQPDGQEKQNFLTSTSKSQVEKSKLSGIRGNKTLFPNAKDAIIPTSLEAGHLTPYIIAYSQPHYLVGNEHTFYDTMHNITKSNAPITRDLPYISTMLAIETELEASVQRVSMPNLWFAIAKATGERPSQSKMEQVISNTLSEMSDLDLKALHETANGGKGTAITPSQAALDNPTTFTTMLRVLTAKHINMFLVHMQVNTKDSIASIRFRHAGLKFKGKKSAIFLLRYIQQHYNNRFNNTNNNDTNKNNNNTHDNIRKNITNNTNNNNINIPPHRCDHSTTKGYSPIWMEPIKKAANKEQPSDYLFDIEDPVIKAITRELKYKYTHNYNNTTYNNITDTQTPPITTTEHVNTNNDKTQPSKTAKTTQPYHTQPTTTTKPTTNNNQIDKSYKGGESYQDQDKRYKQQPTYISNHNTYPVLEGLITSPMGKTYTISTTTQNMISNIIYTLKTKENIQPHQFRITIAGKPYHTSETINITLTSPVIIRTSLSIKGGTQAHKIPTQQIVQNSNNEILKTQQHNTQQATGRIFSQDDYPRTCNVIEGKTMKEMVKHHLDRIEESAHRYEDKYLGTESTTWVAADPELKNIISSSLGIPVHHEISVCKVINGIRITSINEGHAELRYITPYNVWSLIESKENWISKEPVPTDIELKCKIIDNICNKIPRFQMLETRLQIKRILETKLQGNIRIGKEIRQKGEKINQYSLYGTIENDTCITCMVSDHKPKWNINHVTKTMYITCKAKTTCIRLPIDTVDHFFGHTTSKRPRVMKIKRNIPEDPQKNEDENTMGRKIQRNNDKRGKLLYPAKIKQCSNGATIQKSKLHGLTVLQYNADRQSNKNMTNIIILGHRHKADVICLQEVEKDNCSDEIISKNHGYNVYRHKNVMILLKQDTIEKIHLPSMIWRSPSNNSMGVTLMTTKGTMIIMNSYLPSGIDRATRDLNDITYSTAIDMHMEINERILLHNFAILVMDANETTEEWGRIQILRGSHTEPHYKNRTQPENNIKRKRIKINNEYKVATASDTKSTESPMGIHRKNMIDAHLETNSHLYEGNGPSPETFTHQQPSRGKDNLMMDVYAKIDYCLLSKNLINNITKSDIDHTPKTWGKEFLKERNNYHTAIITDIEWENLYSQPKYQYTPQNSKKLKGSTLPLGPNMKKLNEQNKILITQEIELELKGKWKTITRISKGKGTHDYKMQTLTNILKKTINEITTKHLGTTKPIKATNHNIYIEADDRFNALKKKINKILTPTKDKAPQTNTKELESEDTWQEVKWLMENKIMKERPKTIEEWTEWRNNGENDLINKRHNIIDDNIANTSPKKLYKQICKPMSSTTITSLWKDGKNITSDECIEDELTDHLRKMGKHTETPYTFKKIKHNPKNTSKHFDQIMDTPTINEILDNIRNYSNGSAGGYDKITPALLKTICLTEWEITVNKTEKEMKRDQAEMKSSQYLYELTLEGEKPPDLQTTKTIKQLPIYVPHILQKIIKHSLKGQNIPQSEKLSIVTPLPKKEGQINDTNSMRPISVGPIIGRLINKIISKRLGDILKKHKLIDPAQFAFLPGGEIFEPINTVIKCFEQSINSPTHTPGKQCYSIFYDISKAYDTIRWESIENALNRVGANEEFINFVMNSHKGTKLAMKTNKPNHITPQIEMHKAIKQGCPLAPILFIMIMDELHKGYREIGGYTLGKTKVSSRGFCDTIQQY